VNYSVAANSTTNSRTGTITVEGQAFTVTQAGIGCSFVINPTSVNVGNAATNGSVSVTTSNGCAWSAAANVAWLHTSSTGSGTGAADYTVDANTNTAARTGTLTIAGQTFTVNQDGAPVPRDLGVMKMTVPKKITLKGVPVTKTAKVSIQNHGSAPETIADAAALNALLTLDVISLGACPSPTATITSPVTFPITLTPKKKLTVVFSVTYDCANDPLATTKTEAHPDYRYLAQLHGVADADINDNNCPHNPPAGGIDPVNPSVKDKGCGGKKPDKTLGADMFTDIVVKDN
jgi:hypothetical protein